MRWRKGCINQRSSRTTRVRCFGAGELITVLGLVAAVAVIAVAWLLASR
jgi:hypothetical protein